MNVNFCIFSRIFFIKKIKMIYHFLRRSPLDKFTIIRRFFFLFTLTFVTTLTFLFSTAKIKASTADERLNGLKKRKLLDERSVLKDIKFRNIGPGIMSGRVVDIDANPADPTEFYAVSYTHLRAHETR